MNKNWKVEKKKAQYERRIRALEKQVHDLQHLVKAQHAHIEYIGVYFDKYRGLPPTGPSTTHMPYPQPGSQTPTLQQYQANTGTSPGLNDQVIEIPVQHMEPVPVQSTSPQEPQGQ